MVFTAVCADQASLKVTNAECKKSSAPQVTWGRSKSPLLKLKLKMTDWQLFHFILCQVPYTKSSGDTGTSLVTHRLVFPVTFSPERVIEGHFYIAVPHKVVQSHDITNPVRPHGPRWHGLQKFCWSGDKTVNISPVTYYRRWEEIVKIRLYSYDGVSCLYEGYWFHLKPCYQVHQETCITDEFISPLS